MELNMDEKLRKKIIKSLNKKNKKQNLQKYDNYKVAELREEQEYLKIAIEYEKKYNFESWFSMFALLVAMISVFLVLNGNISLEKEKLMLISENTESLSKKIDSTTENINSEKENINSEIENINLEMKLISENISSNNFFAGELAIVMAMALVIFICYYKICLNYGVDIVTYEYEIKYIEKLIEKKLGKHDINKIDEVYIKK